MLLFDGESHGSIHSCSFSRRNAVLKQTTSSTWAGPLVIFKIKCGCSPPAPALFPSSISRLTQYALCEQTNFQGRHTTMCAMVTGDRGEAWCLFAQQPVSLYGFTYMRWPRSDTEPSESSRLLRSVFASVRMHELLMTTALSEV